MHNWGELDLLNGDIVSKRLGSGYHWDAHVYDALAPYLDGDVVDIGANVGALTIRFAQVAPRVIAYEPNLEMVSLLEKNLIRLGLRDKVVIIPEALYDSETTMAPHKTGYPPSSWMWEYGGVTRAAPGSWPEMDRRVSAIKSDVQGADLHALLGLERVILRDRPRIVFEYEREYSGQHGHTWEHYVDQINKVWGYTITRIMEGNEDYFCDPS